MSEAATLAAIDTSEILFKEGVIGVPRAQRYQLLEEPGSPIRLLRSLDIPGFMLPVVDPYLADRNYKPRLGARIPKVLGMQADDPVLFLAVTTLERTGPVVNLKAPLVINVNLRLGLQVILDDRSYSLRAPIRTSP